MTRRVLVGLPLLFSAACRIETDPGPVETASQSVDGGQVELVTAQINMTAGDLEILAGGAGLLDATFRFSRRLGKPEVRYEATGFRGRLYIESPPTTVGAGGATHKWKLAFGDKYPLDIHLRMGAGEGSLDFSRLPLRRLEAELGAGELRIDLRGAYARDLEATIRGGVGQATIRLPKTMGVVVDAKGGIGAIETRGLIKRGDRYYNEAHSTSKPAIQLTVRGGVGHIHLIADE